MSASTNLAGSRHVIEQADLSNWGAGQMTDPDVGGPERGQEFKLEMGGRMRRKSLQANSTVSAGRPKSVIKHQCRMGVRGGHTAGL